MKTTKSLVVSAVFGFVIVIAVMLFSIYLEKVNITGAAVAAESAGNIKTIAVIVLALIVMGFIAFFYSKKQ